MNGVHVHVPTLQAEVCFGMASDAFPASGGGGARARAVWEPGLGGELLLGAQLQWATSINEQTSGGPLNSSKYGKYGAADILPIVRSFIPLAEKERKKSRNCLFLCSVGPSSEGGRPRESLHISTVPSMQTGVPDSFRSVFYALKSIKKNNLQYCCR